MIEVKNRKNRNSNSQDKTLLRLQNERIQKENQIQLENSRKKKKLTLELLQMSLQDKERLEKSRKDQKEKEIKDMKEFLNDNQEKSQMLNFENYQKKREIKESCQKYLNDYMIIKKEKSELEKEDDKRFLKDMMQRHDNYDQKNKEWFKGIRNGYKQNWQVWNHYKDLNKVKTFLLMKIDSSKLIKWSIYLN